MLSLKGDIAVTGLECRVRYHCLRERVVLVTGGASGIGRSIVTAFAAQGARIAFLDLDEKAASQTMAACGADKALFRKCDLTDVTDLRSAIAEVRQKLGPISVLVNNAGNDDRHFTRDVTPDYFDDRIARNLKHYIFTAQAVVDDMIAQGGGSIVNLGSIAWKIGEADCPIYLACKAAITGLTRGLAREFGKQGVRVNTVLPGWVMTERQIKLWLTPAGEAEIERAQCLSPRLQPEDIAAMVLYLASDQARMCTSQDFIVDGGWV